MQKHLRRAMIDPSVEKVSIAEEIEKLADDINQAFTPMASQLFMTNVDLLQRLGGVDVPEARRAIYDIKHKVAESGAPPTRSEFSLAGKKLFQGDVLPLAPEDVVEEAKRSNVMTKTWKPTKEKKVPEYTTAGYYFTQPRKYGELGFGETTEELDQLLEERKKAKKAMAKKAKMAKKGKKKQKKTVKKVKKDVVKGKPKTKLTPVIGGSGIETQEMKIEKPKK